MSRRSRNSAIRSAALVATSLLMLAGCSSVDYLNHRDRVTLAGGNAVRANLERETINPSKASMYKTTGLGKDGKQIPVEQTQTTTTAP
jgi:hypothetical protein